MELLPGKTSHNPNNSAKAACVNKFKMFVLILSLTTLAACSHFSKQDKPSNRHQFNRANVSLEVEVLLPSSYGEDKNRRYPVIYLLDGYWNKEPILTAYNALRFDNMIPEAIIVSVGYPAKVVDYETQRMWDLTPTFDAGFKAGGNGAVLLGLLSGEVVPFLQNNYRIDKSRTLLTGHSLAGLFTLYSLYERPETFTHYAAISPSALWAKNTLANIDQVYSKKADSLTAHVYITYETDEYAPYVTAIKNYLDQLHSRRYKGLNLTVTNVQGMGHVSMKAEGYMRAIVWSFADIRPNGPSEFTKKNLRALHNTD